jgi:hypothetical protein
VILSTNISFNFGSSSVYATDSKLLLRQVSMFGNTIRKRDLPSGASAAVEEGGAAIYCETRAAKGDARLAVRDSEISQSQSSTGAAGIFARGCHLELVSCNVSNNVGPRGAVAIYSQSSQHARVRARCLACSSSSAARFVRLARSGPRRVHC